MIEAFMQGLLAPLGEPYFQKALIGGSMVAVVSGVVGSLVVLRRMAFLGDALAHAMIAGVAGGYLLMKVVFGEEAHAPGMLVGSLLAAVVTVFLIGFVSRASRIKEDASIGIMYTGVFAAGVVLVSIFRDKIHIDLMHFIMGDVLAVGDADLLVAAAACGVVLTIILLFYRHFQILSFDPVMAAALGAPVALLDYALTTCVSLVVVSAVSMVGVILVVGLLITPAATAYLLSDRLERMMALAAVFGVSSVVGGLYMCVLLDASGGGAIMLFCTLQFLVALVAAPRYGLIAKRLRSRAAPEQVVEDVMALAIREPGPTPLNDLRERLDEPRWLRRAVKALTSRGLAVVEDDALTLTPSGRERGEALVRAHRLWEAYLDHVGAPPEELHTRAKELEHVQDASALAYLDDLLQHPDTDPHGQPIPAAPGLTPGTLAPVSLLREGHAGVVARVDEAAASIPLDEGVHIAVGPRRVVVEHTDSRQSSTIKEAVWVVQTEGGQAVHLRHHEADAVTVRLEASPDDVAHTRDAAGEAPVVQTS